MSKITNAENYPAFIEECRFFFCDSLYEGDWDGKEKYILASDTSEEVLWAKYPEIMEELSPYLFCSAACGEVYAESRRNIEKFNKRRLNTWSFGSVDDVEDQVDYDAEDTEVAVLIEEGLSVCTPTQRERISKYYLEGLTLRQIADGANISSVQQSINAGLKKIRNFFEGNP
jgi:DNA-directed RNA polymerase specialized sigma subunit